MGRWRRGKGEFEGFCSFLKKVGREEHLWLQESLIVCLEGFSHRAIAKRNACGGSV